MFDEEFFLCFLKQRLYFIKTTFVHHSELALGTLRFPSTAQGRHRTSTVIRKPYQAKRTWQPSWLQRITYNILFNLKKKRSSCCIFAGVGDYSGYQPGSTGQCTLCTKFTCIQVQHGTLQSKTYKNRFILQTALKRPHQYQKYNANIWQTYISQLPCYLGNKTFHRHILVAKSRNVDDVVKKNVHI